MEIKARVSETDPFSDAAFVGRLNKLLPMLGSAQPAEADTARRKLQDHLAQYRLNFTDLAQRLQADGGRGGLSAPGRETSLERQLAAARAARQEAATDAIAATARAEALQTRVHEANIEIRRAYRTASRARSLAAAGWLATALAAGLAVLPRLWPASHGTAPAHPAAAQLAAARTEAVPGGTYAPDTELHAGQGETLGQAAVQDLALRLNPNDDASVRAFLNRGERVIIHETMQQGKQTWLLVRTATGVGWVRAGDVEH